MIKGEIRFDIEASDLGLTGSITRCHPEMGDNRSPVKTQHRLALLHNIKRARMANEPTRRDVCDDEKLTIRHFVCLLSPVCKAGRTA